MMTILMWPAVPAPISFTCQDFRCPGAVQVEGATERSASTCASGLESGLAFGRVAFGVLGEAVGRALRCLCRDAFGGFDSRVCLKRW